MEKLILFVEKYDCDVATVYDPNVEEAGEFIGVQKDGNQSTVTTVGKKFATNFFYKDVKN